MVQHFHTSIVLNYTGSLCTSKLYTSSSMSWEFYWLIKLNRSKKLYKNPWSSFPGIFGLFTPRFGFLPEETSKSLRIHLLYITSMLRDLSESFFNSYWQNWVFKCLWKLLQSSVYIWNTFLFMIEKILISPKTRTTTGISQL